MVVQQFKTRQRQVQKVQEEVLHQSLKIGIVLIFVRLRPGGVEARAVQNQAHTAIFGHRGFALRVRAESLGDFEQAHARRALSNVDAHILQEAGGQFGAQHVLIGGERVEDIDPAFGGQAQMIEVLIAHKAVIDGLVQPQTGRPFFDPHQEVVAAFG